jgi:probable rRNA maturation factor
MALRVTIQLSPGATPVNRRRLADLLRYAAQQEGLDGALSIWVCRDDEIAALHERYQGIAGPTDVLTFPNDPPYLGDIAVSADTAAVQAAEAGHSPGREIAYLALHGLLHLAGYDDQTEAERARMLARQDALLAAFEQESPGAWERPSTRQPRADRQE